MRTSHTQISICYRFCFVFVAALVVIAGLAESQQSFLSVSAKAAGANAAVSAAGNSISAFRWNLDDAALPLLTLPEHISGAVDLSITYSMDQFQFPLFQSLYYNERAGKYILMVMPRDLGPAEFIDLTPAEGQHQFEAKGNSSFRLEDRGNAKLLTTADGTVYTFSLFGNGEFHCSQIQNRDASVIALSYTDDACIDTILDNAGRTIRFGYEKDSLNSITQTWGPFSVKKQTWAVADGLVSPTPVSPVRAGVEIVKHIPSNARTPAYSRAMAASDSMLAAIFGGPGAVAAANAFEPIGLPSQYPLYRGDLIGDDGKLRRGHLSYAMHLYGSPDGRGDTEIYIPSGFTSHSNLPTPTDAAVTFYYPRLGNLTDVTLAVFHVANFALKDEGARVRIGTTGGPGGSIACYRHAHLEFYRGDTGLPPSASRPRLRIDPVTVFEITAEMTSRAAITTEARPRR